MKLSNENISAAQKNIDRDIRMLECIESMHKKMEYEVSCEDPNVSYISIDGLRLIFENGTYKGWYVFKEEIKENVSDELANTINDINNLKKLVKSFFSKFDLQVDVNIYEYHSNGFLYTKITVYGDGLDNYKKYMVATGSIENLASLPQKEFYSILVNASWVWVY